MVAFAAVTANTSTADGATSASGIWRFKNVADKQISTAKVASVDYDGTNLIAGAWTSNVVYNCSDPLATSRTAASARANKRPGLSVTTHEAIIARWNGADVIAGGQGDMSAFAVSSDNGLTFNDISLIDTALTNITDTAVSADGSVIYFVSDDGTDLSLFRYDGSWQRVLAVGTMTDAIIRIAPDDPDVVYLADRGTTTVYYSNNGGTSKWFLRTCNVSIVDLAVESAEVVYAIEAGGTVSKSTYAGFTWNTAKDTTLDSGRTLVSVMEDYLLAGSGNGYVAYSSDGGSTWKKISKAIQSGADNVSVIADADFANNNLIYAGTDQIGQDIKRYEIGVSTDWSDIFSGTIAGEVRGLAQQGGVLYALEWDVTTNTSALWQCTTPTTATSGTGWNEKDTSTSTDQVSLNAYPQALKSSAGSNKLWAIDTTGGSNNIYSFSDTLAASGPVLLGPADAFSNPVNTVTGNANEISFSWERLSTATNYKLYISYDSGFKESVTTVDVPASGTTTLSTVAIAVGPDRTTNNQQVNWLPGKTYYWRVKVVEPLNSAYSETRSIIIEPGAALVPTILSPANGATAGKQMPSFSWSPVSGSTEYQFVLADNVAMTSPMVNATVTTTGYAVTTALEYGKTYYWRVKPLAPVEGNWSAIANFTVMDKPAAPAATQPPVTITQVPPTFTIPAAQPAPTITIPPIEQPAQIAPAYIWAIIIIGAVLVIAVIVLIVRTRRTV